jgi:hypothetical protein
MGKSSKKAPARPSAIVRAEHHRPPAHLSAPEKRVLGEALRLGEDLAQEVEAKITAFGRWLLEAVFANDAAAALDDKTKNPVWMELVRRAGGPTLRVNKKVLYVALKLAAYDRRITDQSWRGLDPGRKELLLPLRDDRRLREAAQHVSKFNQTQTKTSAYVGELLAQAGVERQVRLSAPVLLGRMRKIQETLGDPAVLKRVRALRAELDALERQALAEEIDKVREVLSAIVREVRGR